MDQPVYLNCNMYCTLWPPICTVRIKIIHTCLNSCIDLSSYWSHKYITTFFKQLTLRMMSSSCFVFYEPTYCLCLQSSPRNERKGSSKSNSSKEKDRPKSVTKPPSREGKREDEKSAKSVDKTQGNNVYLLCWLIISVIL